MLSRAHLANALEAALVEQDRAVHVAAKGLAILQILQAAVGVQAAQLVSEHLQLVVVGEQRGNPRERSLELGRAGETGHSLEELVNCEVALERARASFEPETTAPLVHPLLLFRLRGHAEEEVQLVGEPPLRLHWSVQALEQRKTSILHIGP